VACHVADGGGSVGPNLTDEFWIHGGTVNNIFKTLKYGVPEKGMIAWEKILTAKQTSDLSNYVLSLKGTKPANPKEPQGIKL
jgi:cytochrome c oxidase cbb3-type subunit 3